MDNRQKKASLRKEAVDKLEGLNSSHTSKCEKLFSSFFIKKLLKHSEKHIGLYYPLKSEASPIQIIKVLWDLGHSVYLPCIDSEVTKLFKEYKRGEKLKINSMGFKEPIGEKFAVKDLSLLIIPLLAFDLKGNRLGRGGGFYDQMLSIRKEEDGFPKIIGLAFDTQEITNFNCDPWDQVLDGILTESRLVLTKST